MGVSVGLSTGMKTGACIGELQGERVISQRLRHDKSRGIVSRRASASGEV